ncbi:MAG TPA: biotin carboxylase N-terminal domain-containing protein, partial [Ornithinibacter sp.]|nr:biotin carboxylase N-terminal domain-containing protein [Ornithinibacter sp.]
MTISRIAVVNRGAAAVRVIHAVRERALELDADLRTIAFYSDEDRGSLFVREADERYPIGPATVAVPGSEHRLSAYLSLPVMQEALVRSGADAAWVGWGYNAENAEFATMCDDLGITFIGAPADVLRRLRDTINAKRLAEGVGIPVARWSGGSVDSVDTARVEAARLGYPVMIKAAAGSGGRGVYDVGREEDLASAFAQARDRARALFGDPTVYLEAAVPGARQVEVQLAADRAGTVWALGVRDSSVQRGHRKIFDEAPSPMLTVEQDAWACDAAIRFAREAGFQGMGSVEFLSDTATGRLLFLEFNARLQAAHPVTEVTTGLDLVELALHLADGGLLQGEPPVSHGHAIAARLLAEDPDHEFAASPGRIELLRFPGGPGLRVDAAVEEGDPMPSVFEPVLATVVAHGQDRTEAIARLRRALAESSVLLEGG